MVLPLTSFPDLCQQQAYLLSCLSRSYQTAQAMRTRAADLEAALAVESCRGAKRRKKHQMLWRTKQTLRQCENDERMVTENLRICDWRIRGAMQGLNLQGSAVPVWPATPVYGGHNNAGFYSSAANLTFLWPQYPNSAPRDPPEDYYSFSVNNLPQQQFAYTPKVIPYLGSWHSDPRLNFSRPHSAPLDGIKEESPEVLQCQTLLEQSTSSDHSLSSESQPEFVFDPAVAPFNSDARQSKYSGLDERAISPRTVEIRVLPERFETSDIRRHSDPGPETYLRLPSLGIIAKDNRRTWRG